MQLKYFDNRHLSGCMCSQVSVWVLSSSWEFTELTTLQNLSGIDICLVGIGSDRLVLQGHQECRIVGHPDSRGRGWLRHGCGFPETTWTQHGTLLSEQFFGLCVGWRVLFFNGFIIFSMLGFASFSGCWFDDDRYYYIKPIHLRKFKNKISTII